MQYFHQILPKHCILQTDWPQTKEAITSLIVWVILPLSLLYCTLSSCSLSSDRSIVSSKAVPHAVWSSIPSFNFQHLPVFLRSSSSCLHLLPHLSVPSIFPSVTHVRWQTLHKMWPIQLAFLCSIVCTHNSCSFCTRSIQVIFPSSSSTTFHVFQCICVLLSQVYKFQHACIWYLHLSVHN
jgi:hypothetical protein